MHFPIYIKLVEDPKMLSFLPLLFINFVNHTIYFLNTAFSYANFHVQLRFWL